jgi:hypothetical protein
LVLESLFLAKNVIQRPWTHILVACSTRAPEPQRKSEASATTGPSSQSDQRVDATQQPMASGGEPENSVRTSELSTPNGWKRGRDTKATIGECLRCPLLLDRSPASSTPVCLRDTAPRSCSPSPPIATGLARLSCSPETGWGIVLARCQRERSLMLNRKY